MMYIHKVDTWLLIRDFDYFFFVFEQNNPNKTCNVNSRLEYTYIRHITTFWIRIHDSLLEEMYKVW